MTTDFIKKTNYYIKKDNEVTKALFFDMTLSAYRILLLAGTDKFLAQLNNPENKDKRIRVSASEYHDIFGKPDSHVSPSFRILKQSVDELLDAKLKFKNFKHEQDEGKWSGGINWISYAAYNDKLKVLELSFSPDILPFIHQVNTKYTYYNLRNIAELTSMHSVRMYELMMFWRKKKRTPNMSVQILKAWLGVRDDLYEDTKLFTLHIVKKSVNEINSKKTNLSLDLIQNKKGRITESYALAINTDLTTDEDHLEEQEEEILDEDGNPQLGF